jgi:hypothetical protein
MTDSQILTGAIELLSNKGLERRMYRAESLNLKLFSLLRKVCSVLESFDSTEIDIDTRTLFEIREVLDNVQMGIEHY